jgi:hypothetical protein
VEGSRLVTEPKEKKDLDREFIELLNELRVALPGVQVLFAFLLVVPFSQGWAKVDGSETATYFTSLISTALAAMFLIAPSAHHRLQWRERDKEWLLQIANKLAIIGTILLAIGTSSAVFFVTHFLFGSIASVVGGGLAVAYLVLWYGFPLYRRSRT